MTKTVERALGGDINDTSLEVLGTKFDELTETLATKKYGIQLEKDQIEYLTMSFLRDIEFPNRAVFDISEVLDVVNSLDSETKVPATKESIRALFHFLLETKTTGVDNVHVIKSTLYAISEVVTEINADDQLLQDAGFELEAAKQGISPEKAVENMNEAQLAEAPSMQPVK